MREKRLIVHGTLAGIIAISVIHLAERGRRRARYAEHTFGAHDRSLRSPHAHRCVVASVFPLDPSESSHIDFRARVVRRRDIARRDASPFAVVVATRPGIVATLTPSPPVPLLQDGLRFPRHALPCRRRAPPRVRGASRLRARPRRARRGARDGGRRSRGPPVHELIDVRVGKVLKASKHEDSDKLYVEEIDLGEAEPRTICSGLAPYMAAEVRSRSFPVAHRSLKRRNF